MATEQAAASQSFKIFKLSNILNPIRPAEHEDYDGHNLGHLPLHKYSNIARGQFRLLQLKSGSGKDQIQFELHTASIDNSPPYEAISYCWGEVVPSCNIMCKDSRLPVTKNGVDALWHFRLPDKPRVLWMDVICINQDNKQEKSEQVTNMHKIYSGAERTLAFGGNASQNDGIVFDFLADFLKVIKEDIIRQVQAMGLHETNPRVAEVVEGSDDWVTWSWLYFCFQNIWEGEDGLKDIWRPIIRLDNKVAKEHVKKMKFKTALALRKMCDREYFRRCWVLQELVLSRHSVLYVGKNEMPWDDFAAAVWIIPQISSFTPGLRSAASPIGQNKARRAWRALNRDDGVGQYSVIVSALSTCNLRAHRPVDRIYAMRNLSTGTSNDCTEKIAVDYQRNLVETNLQLGQSIMSGTSAEEKAVRLSFILPYLKFTTRHESGALPSWVPDMEALTAADLHLMALYATFRASTDFEHLKSAYLLPPENPQVLAIRGRVIDGVLSFSDLEPSPIYGPHGIEYDELEVAEYQVDGAFIATHVLPSWVDYFRMMSTEAKPSNHPTGLQEHVRSQLRDMLSTAIRRIRIARDFAGDLTDEDTFWRAFLCNIDPRVSQKAAGDKPFPGIDAVAFLDATPTLAEAFNWTIDHPITKSIPLAKLIDAYHFLSNIEHWRGAKFSRTGSGNLAWLPAKAQLEDKICLFGGNGTFHVIRADPKVSGRWKVIGPAYVHGLMDGESAAITPINEDDFLFIS